MLAAVLADLWPYLAAGLAALGTLWGWGRSKRAQGRAEITTQAKEQDHAKAADIRNRVERDLPDRLHDFDSSGYRD